MRILLTPTERRRPWIIYATPGLFAAQFIHLAYKIIFVGSLKALLLPGSEESDDKPLLNASPLAIGVMIIIGLLSTVILCPLEVIASKLAIQRNHAAPEYNSVSQEVEEDGITPEEYVEYAGADEDVIGYVPPLYAAWDPLTLAAIVCQTSP